MKHLAILLLASSTAYADAKLGGRVTDRSGAPIAGATVVVIGGGAQHSVTTGADGRYQLALDGSGRYSVAMLSGADSVLANIKIADGRSAVLDGKLDAGGGEVILIHEHQRSTYAKPLKDPTILPPYSDEAVLDDAWTRAWLLLDVSATGAVTQLKFLKRPGYDLEHIAIDQGLHLQFEPARDGSGTPVRSLVVWPIEWPSHDWLVARLGTTTRMLTPVWGRRGTEVLPACAGSGPLELDSVHPVYRDCSVPNLAHADASEPWLKAVPKP